jgi:hypothetical protein
MISLYQDSTTWRTHPTRPCCCYFWQTRVKSREVGTPHPMKTVWLPTHNTNYTFSFPGRKESNQFSLETCLDILKVSKSALTISRADIGRPLLETLPVDQSGTYTLVLLAIPFILAFHQPDPSRERLPFQIKRWNAMTAPGRSFNPHVYIDAIGIPWGVPNKFKVRNQIATGFKLGFFWWSIINKNVDWINYVYYSQQRFINYTRDAVEGIAKQLDTTSQMAFKKMGCP